MDRTKTEEKAGERFSNGDINSEAEFGKVILEVYDDVLGVYGKNIFTSQVMPRLLRLYGNNFRKMGERALDLIDEGGSRKGSEIDKYFSSVLVKELESKGKMVSMFDLGMIINDTILECEEEFQLKYSSPYNVIGAVIYGSFVQGNQQPNSDLDILYLVRWKNPDGISNLDRLDYVDDFDPKEDFDFCEHFENKIRKRLKIKIDNFNGSVVLEDKDKLLDLLYGSSNIIGGRYQVASPFNWIHEKVAEYIKDRK